MVNKEYEAILENIECDKQILFANECGVLLSDTMLLEDGQTPEDKKESKMEKMVNDNKEKYKKFKKLTKDIKKRSDQEIIDGPNYIAELVKIVTASTGLAFIAGFQAIVPYIAYRYMKTNVSQKKRAKFYNEMNVELNIVNSKLEDFNGSGLSEEEKNEKYKLVKTKSILVQNINKIEPYLKSDPKYASLVYQVNKNKSNNF